MSNLKIKDKILKLGSRYGLTPSAQLLLESLIDKSDKGYLKDGDLYNYQSIEPHFVKLFSGGLDEYYAAFLELLNGKFISYDREKDYVFIKPFLGNYFHSILGVIEGRKRRYIKSPQTLKNEYNTFLAKYGSKMNYIPELSDDQLVRYTTKSSGVKIPDSLRPYFTGEPIKNYEGKVISKFDNNYLKRERDRRNLTKEEKRVYYACMKFADTNGIIDDFNTRSLVNSIIIEYGDGSLCQSTVYLALNKLFELGLLYSAVNNRSSVDTSSCLVIAGYKEAFARRERYVIIPDVVLDKAFKKCEASTIKIFFRILFMLNNGDGGEGNLSGVDKVVRLSFKKFLPKNNKQNIADSEDWLKKRYPGELYELVWGDINNSDINSLSFFFYITPLTKPNDSNNSDLSYMFKIRKEFYISKKVDLYKKYLALTGKDKKRSLIIEDALKKHNIKCSNDDLYDLVKIFRGAGSKNINFVISQLSERIEATNKGWTKIRSISAYVYALYANRKSAASSPGEVPLDPVPDF